jgi:hypothetical protein
MPSFHVAGMGFQIGPGFIVMVVKIEIKMVGLQVDKHKNAWHSTRKLAEAIEGVLSLERHTRFEFFAVNLSASTNLLALFPGTRRFGMEGPPSPELSLNKSIHSGLHVREMRRAETLKNSCQACRIGNGPSLVCVVSKTETRDFRVTAGAEHRIRVHAIEHPSTKAHGLQHKGTGVTGSHEFCRAFHEGILLNEAQGQEVLLIEKVSVSFETRNSLPADIVIKAETVLKVIAQVGNLMLSHIACGNNQQASRTIDNPGVVGLNVRIAGWKVKAAIAELAKALAMGTKHRIEIGCPAFFPA